MTLPTLHDNGTPARMLAASAEAAYDALQEAYDLLRQTGPNLRDFQHEREYALAEGEHRGRLTAVQAVMDDMEKLVGHCERKAGER